MRLKMLPTEQCFSLEILIASKKNTFSSYIVRSQYSHIDWKKPVLNEIGYKLMFLMRPSKTLISRIEFFKKSTANRLILFQALLQSFFKCLKTNFIQLFHSQSDENIVWFTVFNFVDKISTNSITTLSTETCRFPMLILNHFCFWKSKRTGKFLLLFQSLCAFSKNEQ